MTSMSAAACVERDAGFSRAWNMKYRRLISGLLRSSRTGRQRSAPSLVNRRGMMPMSVAGAPLRMNVCPRIFGSRLYCFSHILSAITKTGGALGAASATVKVRPSTAGTPEERERVGGDEAAGVKLGPLTGREQHILACAADDLLEDLVLLLVLEELGDLKCAPAARLG